VRQAIFGIAAAHHQRHHAVADLPALDVRAECYDFAGDLEPRNIGRAGRRRVEALALHHVGPVDAGSRHLHQDLAGAGVGTARSSDTKASGPPGALMPMAVMRVGSAVIKASISKGRRFCLGGRRLCDNPPGGG
jgi:hypothetical protein